MPRLDQPPAGDRHTGVQNVPNKLLTPEQKAELEKRGAYIPGVGSAYVANQPTVDEKPEQQVVNPPRSERGLSPETIKGLEGLAAAQTKTPEETVKEADQISRDFDYSEIGNQMRSLINNKERREKIEARITDPINVEDLIIHQELRQTVPIIPGKFVPQFRSVGGHEDLWVKRQMGIETGSDNYIMDKYAMMNLCCGLFSLNGKPLPSHLDGNGFIEPTAFDKKYNALLKYPWNLLADLSVNYVWFLRRVERALVVDEIKGF